MQLQIQSTLCPVVKSEVLQLARYGEVNGVGRRDWLRFEQEIHWIRESSATVSFTHGGVPVGVPRSSYSDYWGFLESLNSAIQGAQEACRRLSVTRQSSLRIAVSVEVLDVPAIAASGEVPTLQDGRRRCFYMLERPDLKWAHFDNDKLDAWSSAKSLDERYKLHSAIPWLRPALVASASAIWSSDLHADCDGLPPSVQQFIAGQRLQAEQGVEEVGRAAVC
ncbi:TPA: hypothetical protein ACG5BG_004798 [Pseudomonas aeruginosa]|uniref:hypothetical protein n=2 Tax=Pseudomonas aeruginosa TaxID=287 RepID=UPI00053E65D8|nr:hypothetical protein [Pseudomonas aeruginosa]EMC2524076.1 hypothetical protein [Pseudomonas aeruginosa]MBA5208010.1 hypothetical protein [Pseudomonas aeruginosa]MBG4574060.1 hypothetical protein [Pseudomonas aeruginosa]MBM9966680.1 hypothetical protein [Pseudomonas aeruginosa]MBN0096868.1 hypothetical protein [Pseudomonas aeruginosa]